MSRPVEVDPRRVRRPLGYTFINDALLSPIGVQLSLLAGLIVGFVMPATLLLTVPGLLLLVMLFADRPFRMPLRMPTDIGGMDLTTEREMPKYRKGLADFSGMWYVPENTCRQPV